MGCKGQESRGSSGWLGRRQASERCTFQSWDTVRPLLPLPFCPGFTFYSLTVKPGGPKGCSQDRGPGRRRKLYFHFVQCHREARRYPPEKQGCPGQFP